MTNSAKYSDSQILDLGNGANRAAIRQVRAELISTKLRISGALSDDKYDMLEDRSDMLSSGVDPWLATLKATAGSDLDWRRRAVAALRITDAQIVKLNAKLKELGGANEQVPFVLSGTPEQIAGSLVDLVARGHYILNLVTIYDKAANADVVLVLAREC